MLACCISISVSMYHQCTYLHTHVQVNFIHMHWRNCHFTTFWNSFVHDILTFFYIILYTMYNVSIFSLPNVEFLHCYLMPKPGGHRTRNLCKFRHFLANSTIFRKCMTFGYQSYISFSEYKWCHISKMRKNWQNSLKWATTINIFQVFWTNFYECWPFFRLRHCPGQSSDYNGLTVSHWSAHMWARTDSICHIFVESVCLAIFLQRVLVTFHIKNAIQLSLTHS